MDRRAAILAVISGALVALGAYAIMHRPTAGQEAAQAIEFGMVRAQTPAPDAEAVNSQPRCVHLEWVWDYRPNHSDAPQSTARGSPRQITLWRPSPPQPRPRLRLGSVRRQPETTSRLWSPPRDQGFGEAQYRFLGPRTGRPFPRKTV